MTTVLAPACGTCPAEIEAVFVTRHANGCIAHIQTFESFPGPDGWGGQTCERLPIATPAMLATLDAAVRWERASQAGHAAEVAAASRALRARLRGHVDAGDARDAGAARAGVPSTADAPVVESAHDVPVLRTMPPAPDAVCAALHHVRSVHPDVVGVVFALDGRWQYLTEEFRGPSFGSAIDVMLLEQAVEAVEAAVGLPAVYYVVAPGDHA